VRRTRVVKASRGAGRPRGEDSTVSAVAADLPSYTIKGGRADADRLARQARVMASATASFLARVRVEAGWRCLDVGCGDGQVTVQLARIVGPGGRAVGIDVDDDALAIAREGAAQAGVQAQFVRADATEPPERDAFDIAYARLVLSHLPDAVAALRAMRAAVRPGGWVAVEDLFTGTLRSEPAAPALDRLQEVYSATVRAHGGDPTIGPRLPALLTAAGLDEAREATVENPMSTVEDKLFLAELVDNMRDTMLASGAATGPELDELRADVERAARDPERVFHQARIHQVWGRRPG
jgi:ubiquinone/menaquinone biosynthesis C-methylase UbiE